MLGWAARRTLRSLGLLLPLASRALPMLLLFMTFLFINTEVWQVSSTLRGGVLWQAVLLFALIGVLFLLARLPEELEEYDQELTAERDRRGVPAYPRRSHAPRSSTSPRRPCATTPTWSASNAATWCWCC